ncbi:MAG: hypothetical protein B6D39_04855 [Anaerolineae bacterium UTCFX2]|jgi:alcohol dehydrogenase|nr:iron-containing alcohol dehydrogenase [Anaerolineales bacterium]OQY92308.1 MAG: hypothetical protein B6D39_04855 [Anaerolineae bacterium UTCFX2]
MDTLTNFYFSFPTRLLFGQGKFNSLGQEAAQFGKKAFLVTYPSPTLADQVDQAVAMLKAAGVETTLFRKAEANPTHTVADEGAELARSSDSQMVIGLGGGSALDLAKAIAVTATGRLKIWDIVEGAPITQPPLPLIAIPTTAGTGSEATQYTVISNREQQRKEGFARREFYPAVAIVDPLLTVSMPPAITAQTGLDVLVHAIEAYIAKVATPASDLFAREALRLCSRYLRLAVYNGNDLAARTNMMAASTLAGIAISHSDTTLAHVIGEAVGAVFNTWHGLTVALCLPAVMEYACIGNLEKFAQISALMGEDISGLSTREAALKSPELVRQLIVDLDMPRGLGALGVTENEQVLKLVTRPGWDAASPRPASRQDFEILIKGCLSPQMSYWRALEEAD